MSAEGPIPQPAVRLEGERVRVVQEGLFYGREGRLRYRKKLSFGLGKTVYGIRLDRLHANDRLHEVELPEQGFELVD